MRVLIGNKLSRKYAKKAFAFGGCESVFVAKDRLRRGGLSVPTGWRIIVAALSQSIQKHQQLSHHCANKQLWKRKRCAFDTYSLIIKPLFFQARFLNRISQI